MSYYAVLNVEPTATVAEIRAAYHKQALKVHPDKVGGNNADFQHLAKAFEVLSDAARRFQYDGCCTAFGTRTPHAGATFGTCLKRPGAPGGHTGTCCDGPVGSGGSCDRRPAAATSARAATAFDRSRGLWGLRGSQQ